MTADEPSPDELAQLYGASLSEFTACRNRLAKELAGSGRTEAAEWIRKLSRPSVALWAVNQLGRQAAGDLENLLDTGVELRAAQNRLMGGDRDAADDLRDLGAEQTASVAQLRSRTAEILTEAGHASADATLRRIETTLRAAATASADVHDAIREGRLTAELEPAGFGEYTGLTVLSRPQAPRRRDPERESRKNEAEAALRAAEVELSQAESVAKRLRREADRAASMADRIRDELTVAETRASEAAVAAGAAETKVGEAEQSLNRARRALRSLD